MFFHYEMTINFIYIQGLLFVIELLLMVIIGGIKPLSTPYQFKPNPKVDMTPWKYTISVVVVLFGSMVFTFVLFSSIGLASQENIVSPLFWPVVVVLAIVVGVLYYVRLKQWSHKYESTLKQQYNKQLKEELNIEQQGNVLPNSLEHSIK
ncbi:hypothetical protein [Mammaliicoccus sciuri]|uniref:hypothetical protein n=1 Tax=Mammaliicoccus sciuri TaxID=1296 RepID=UPI001FB52DAB|nr:hypothetical protein [Mammaliicoccus sciuri]MCJ1778182.1 hypothetical protein [Mammaliicoccus sciuri]